MSHPGGRGISCGFFEPQMKSSVDKGKRPEEHQLVTKLKRQGNETFLMTSEGLSSGSVIRE